MTNFCLVQMSIGTNVLASRDQPACLHKYLAALPTGNIACTARIPVLPPGPANALVLVVNLEVHVPKTLRNPNTKIDTRVTRSDDSHLKRPLVLDWFILASE